MRPRESMLGTVLASLRTHWLLAFLMFAIGLVVTHFVVSNMQAKYSSIATIVINRTFVEAVTENPDSDPGKRLGSPVSMLDQHVALLKSREVHDKTAQSLIAKGMWKALLRKPGQKMPWDQEEELTEKALKRRLLTYLSASVKVQKMRGSNVLNLVVTGPKPRAAKNVLKILLEEYEKRRRDLFDISATLEVRNDTYEVAKTKLTSARDALYKFRKKYEILNGQRERVRIGEAIRDLQAQVDGLALDEEFRKAAVAATKAEMEKLPTTLEGEVTRTPNPNIKILSGFIAEYQMRLEGLRAITAETDHKKWLRDKIETLKEQLEAESPMLEFKNPERSNPAYESLQTRLNTYSTQDTISGARYRMLAARLAQKRKRLKELEVIEPDENALMAAFESAEEEERNAKRKLDSILRVHELDQARVLWSHRILQEPSLALGASGRGPLTYYAIGVMLSLGLGVGSAFLRGKLDKRIRDRSTLGGMVPNAIICEVPANEEPIQQNGRGASTGIAVRVIREMRKYGPKRFVVAVIADEDTPESSWGSYWVSRILATNGVNTLLISGGALPKEDQWSRRLVRLEATDVTVLSRGEEDPIVVERSPEVEQYLTEAQDMAFIELQDDMAQRPDVMVMSAPEFRSGKAGMAAAIADAWVIVVRKDKTTKSTLQAMIEALKETGAKPLGAVMVGKK